MGVFKINQFLVQDISLQAQTVQAVAMVNLTVDAIFVNALGQQLGNDFKDDRAVGVISESPRIGHHSAVKAFGHFAPLLLKLAQLPQQRKDHLTC